MTELVEIEQSPTMDTVVAALVREVAMEDAPRPFAIVEEYGEGEDARAAGYGFAHDDHADVTSVEGDFHLSAESAENARALFEISSRSTGVRRVHVVWLDEAAAIIQQH